MVFRKKNGFTLVELLAVIIILGIILAIALQSYKNILKNDDSDKLNKYLAFVEDATDLSIEGYKDTFITGTCMIVDYSSLNQDLLKKDDISCDGKVIVSKNGYAYKYDTSHLRCIDKDGKVLQEGSTIDADTQKTCSSSFSAKYDYDSTTNKIDISASCSDPMNGIKKYKFQLLNSAGSVLIEESSNESTHLFRDLPAGTTYYTKAFCTNGMDTEKEAVVNCKQPLDANGKCPITTKSYTDPTLSLIKKENNGWVRELSFTVHLNDVINVDDAYGYFYSDVNGTSGIGVYECSGSLENGFNCGSTLTKNIVRGRWYKMPSGVYDAAVQVNDVDGVTSSGKVINAAICSGNCGVGKYKAVQQGVPKMDLFAPDFNISYKAKTDRLTVNVNLIRSVSGISNYYYKITDTTDNKVAYEANTLNTKVEISSIIQGHSYSIEVIGTSNNGLSTTRRESGIVPIDINSVASVSLSETRGYNAGYSWDYSKRINVGFNLTNADLVENPTYYFKTGYNATTSAVVYECSSNIDNLNCSGSPTNNIQADRFYRSDSQSLNFTYVDGTFYRSNTIAFVKDASGNRTDFNNSNSNFTSVNYDSKTPYVNLLNFSRNKYQKGTDRSINGNFVTYGHDGLSGEVNSGCTYNNIKDISSTGSYTITCSYTAGNGRTASNSFNVTIYDMNDANYTKITFFQDRTDGVGTHIDDSKWAYSLYKGINFNAGGHTGDIYNVLRGFVVNSNATVTRGSAYDFETNQPVTNLVKGRLYISNEDIIHFKYEESFESSVIVARLYSGDYIGGIDYSYTDLKLDNVIPWISSKGSQTVDSGSTSEILPILFNFGGAEISGWNGWKCDLTKNGVNYYKGWIDGSTFGSGVTFEGLDPGDYSVSCTVVKQNNTFAVANNVLTINDPLPVNKQWVYYYTGGIQSFSVPFSGRYKFEVYGGQGGTLVGHSNSLSPKPYYKGGLGGYSSGITTLNKNDSLNVYVGGTPGYYADWGSFASESEIENNVPYVSGLPRFYYLHKLDECAGNNLEYCYDSSNHESEDEFASETRFETDVYFTGNYFRRYFKSSAYKRKIFGFNNNSGTGIKGSTDAQTWIIAPGGGASAITGNGITYLVAGGGSGASFSGNAVGPSYSGSDGAYGSGGNNKAGDGTAFGSHCSDPTSKEHCFNTNFANGAFLSVPGSDDCASLNIVDEKYKGGQGGGMASGGTGCISSGPQDHTKHCVDDDDDDCTEGSSGCICKYSYLGSIWTPAGGSGYINDSVMSSTSSLNGYQKGDGYVVITLLGR